MDKLRLQLPQALLGAPPRTHVAHEAGEDAPTLRLDLADRDTGTNRKPGQHAVAVVLEHFPIAWNRCL